MTRHDDDRTDLPSDDLDRTLDDAVGRLRDNVPSDAEARAARGRAWERLAAEAASDPCASLAADVPGLEAGTLSPERAMLVATHVRECVRCRRALKESRLGVTTPPAAPSATAPRSSWRFLRLAAAVAGIAAVGLVAATLFDQVGGSTQLARVIELEGDLLAVGDESSTPLALGSDVEEGQRVRTARGSWAALELADGSRVEVNERTEISIGQDGEATTVRLGRGDVIVTAAQRRSRNLFVDTDDCSVAVKGTVFTVGHGLKGSRVGVLEGEVHVNDSGTTRRLRKGDQVTTREELEPSDLAAQVGWSRTADRYATFLTELDAVARELEANPLERNVRHSSTLLDAMPADTVLFAGLPNTPGNVQRLTDLVRERVKAAPELATWWEAQAAEARKSGEPTMDQLIDRLQRLSGSVGDEIALALVLQPRPQGGTASPVPVLVAKATDETTLVDLIDREVGDELRASGAPFAGILDREGLRSASRGDGLVVLDAGHVLAGSEPHLMGLVADALAGRTRGSFAGSAFHRTIAQQYRGGAEVVVAVDLERLVEAHGHVGDADGRDMAEDLREVGLRNLEHFVLASGDEGRAVLSFKEARTGLASWLAEPAPLGSLAFISPQATAVFAMVVKDPSAMLADVAAIAGDTKFAEGLAEFRAGSGLDLVEDVAEPLGGELAFALDGPLLPTPGWKLVVEVYDADTLQATIARVVEKTALAPDRTTAAPTLREVEIGDGVAHVLTVGAVGEIWYAFRDGYVVACPGRTLLESALQARDLGVSFATSPALTSLLPKDGEENVSLLAYQDFGKAVGPLLEQLRATGSVPAELALSGESSACLVFGRASDTAITLGVRSASTEPGARLAAFLRGTAVRLLLAEALERNILDHHESPAAATSGN